MRCNLSKPSITQINSLKEHWKICINATIKFWGHKNKTRDCRESITSDNLPFYKSINCIE